MIDFRLRNEHIAAAAADPTTAVILLDVVLGYGAHPDPAGALVPAIDDAARRDRVAAPWPSWPPCAAPRAIPRTWPRQEAALSAAGVDPRAEQCGGGPARRAARGRRGGGVTAVEPARAKSKAGALFPGGLHAVNVGVAEFSVAPRAHGATVVPLDWRPPAGGDRDLGLVLARLEDDPDDPIGARVAAANRLAVERLLAARPVLVDVQPAALVVPGLGARTHPARGTADRVGAHVRAHARRGHRRHPVRGLGGHRRGGRARSPRDGSVDFAPCHHHGAVGPMAGILSPSMPVAVVENRDGGQSRLRDAQRGARQGCCASAPMGPMCSTDCGWMAGTLAPALARALAARGPVDLRSLTAQALQMGDECHNRNVAATSLFTRLLAPALVRTSPPETAAAVLDFLGANDHFFLNLSMAACKSALDAAHGIADATVVTAMARNGVEFGIRVSGAGDRWFTAPALVPDGLYFPGHGPAEANPDLGDSAITETMGLGGFAMAAAPAIVRFVGGSPEDALAYTREMATITLARNAGYGIPALGFAGTPTGHRLPARRRQRRGRP